MKTPERKLPTATISIGTLVRDASKLKKKDAPSEKKTPPKPTAKTGSVKNESRGKDRRTLRTNEQAVAGAKGLSNAEQRALVLSTLAINGQTSYFFRNNGCYQVPTRVHELRKLGHDIKTTFVTIVDAGGWTHPRCAFYELGDQGQLSLDFVRKAANDPQKGRAK